MRHNFKLQSRQGGGRPPRPTALIVCEGTKTEPRYFHALKKHLRVSGIDVKPMGKDPEKLVEEAVKIRHKHEISGGAKYDAVWVVFDTERHGTYNNLPQLIQNAERKGIKVAPSCPCFEVWLLLHFEFTTGHLSECRRVEEKLNPHLMNYEKSTFQTDLLMDRLTAALGNSAKLRQFHERPGGGGQLCNPSTKVDVLVSWIKGAVGGC